MVGRAIQMTVLPQLALGPGYRCPHRMLGRRLWCQVGVVGSAAPWFLTGWADGVEVELMIDTGCQVTILATSVFERMCASDLRVRSRLRLCGRWLVLANSSPLTVRGELEMTVVFP